jgi:hypothetical protein
MLPVARASLLQLDYGRNIDRLILGTDSFYAPRSLYFVAFAETKFLNMLESKLACELDQSVLIRQKNPILSNLLYAKQILERHIQRIFANIMSIEGRTSKWPTRKEQKGNAATESLLRDYQHLLSRAKHF